MRRAASTTSARSHDRPGSLERNLCHCIACHRVDRHRRRLDHQRPRAHQAARDALVHRGHAIGVDEQRGQSDEAVGLHRHAPRHAVALEEPALEGEGVGAAAWRLHHHMLGGDVALEVQPLAGQRPAAPHHADEVLPEGRLARVVGRHEARRDDQQVGLTALQETVRLVYLRREHEAHAGLLLRGQRHLLRAEHELRVVRREEPERAVAALRVEGRRCADRAVDTQQQVAHGVLQRPGAGRELQLAANLHQQLVVEVFAQAPERVADGRGTEVQQAIILVS
jgi:hypothetical protein